MEHESITDRIYQRFLKAVRANEDVPESVCRKLADLLGTPRAIGAETILNAIDSAPPDGGEKRDG